MTLVRCAGLPDPEVNAPLDIGHAEEVTPDLLFADWRSVVEYEGSQHQEDRWEYTKDIDRYAVYRRLGYRYTQITKERLRSPKVAVGRIYQMLVEAGYDGPPPVFGDLWTGLFQPLSEVAGRYRPRRGA